MFVLRAMITTSICARCRTKHAPSNHASLQAGVISPILQQRTQPQRSQVNFPKPHTEQRSGCGLNRFVRLQCSPPVSPEQRCREPEGLTPREKMALNAPFVLGTSVCASPQSWVPATDFCVLFQANIQLSYSDSTKTAQ